TSRASRRAAPREKFRAPENPASSTSRSGGSCRTRGSGSGGSFREENLTPVPLAKQARDDVVLHPAAGVEQRRGRKRLPGSGQDFRRPFLHGARDAVARDA